MHGWIICLPLGRTSLLLVSPAHVPSQLGRTQVCFCLKCCNRFAFFTFSGKSFLAYFANSQLPNCDCDIWLWLWDVTGVDSLWWMQTHDVPLNTLFCKHLYQYYYRSYDYVTALILFVAYSIKTCNEDETRIYIHLMWYLYRVELWRWQKRCFIFLFSGEVLLHRIKAGKKHMRPNILWFNLDFHEDWMSACAHPVDSYVGVGYVS